MVSITDSEFEKLSEYIKANYGIQLKKEKKALVIGRLHNVLQEMAIDNFTDYYEHIMSDKSGKAVITLMNKITTNHTFFMREDDHFYFYRDKILPYLSSTLKEKDIRVWSAGCSSGEEPYTIAMINHDYFGKDKYLWDTKVLATDISSKVLDIAVKGVYSSEQIEPTPESWKITYFKRYDSNSYIMVDKIRNDVVYRRFNLMESKFPFKKKFHVIFCRNVMIYFDNKTRTELIDKFYQHLEYGGYLFIGHSESINRENARFKYVLPAIYRKE